MPMFCYKVLSGHHVIGEKAYGKTSPNGNVFETEQNLLKYNLPGLQARFELLAQKSAVEQQAKTTSNESVTTSTVPVSASSKSQDDGLETQTVAELKAFASDARIDILGLNRKDEIIAAIRRAVASS